MRVFCTYFDKRYLSRGLAMYYSLQQHSLNSKLWILCLDAETNQYLTPLALPNVEIVSIEELEGDCPPLRDTKKNRSLLEYYFTCTPSLPLFILNRNQQIDLITYLDADLFFFSDVEPLFNEIGGHSIAIIPHCFPTAFRKAERHGIFNVGWVSFRRDDEGLNCLRLWQSQCIEWCADQSDENRFADQQYLDDWPARFRNLVVLHNKGANLAPWNIANYRISKRNGRLFVDDAPLLFFHFHGLRQLNGYVFDTCLQHYGAKLTPTVREEIYLPYVRKINALAKESGSAFHAPLARNNLPHPSSLGRTFDMLKRLLQRHYLLVLRLCLL